MAVFEMRNARKAFGVLEVLKGVSLKVEKGEVVSIIGPSGGGKSTMLRCATLLETMDSGTLAYGENVAAREENGKSVYAGKAALAQVRRQFGLVFQQFDLFPHYTVLKNVCDAPISVQKRDKAEVEAELKARLGLSKIIWLPGIAGEDITDGHVDFYARFVRPGVVIANLDNDPDSYDHAVTRKHLEILKQATDAEGRKLQVHVVSPPLRGRRNKFSKGNDDFAAGYINYFVINGAIIAPQFGDAQADEKARALLAALYPGRDIVQLDIDAIAAGGGGIHCVTHQCPAV
jgi:ABC-type Fe3+/spermidine/putrescine transport system ATPase subunit